MKIVTCGGICVAAFLLLAFSATAQMGMRGGPPAMHGVWHPEVGSGAAYDLQTKGSQSSTFELTVLGKESVAGADGYWTEITMNNAQMGGEMIIKTLVVVNGDNSQAAQVIMQMPGGQPMIMPSQMAQAHQKPQSADIRNDAEDAGAESVTIPAGTYACEHYRMKDGSGDAWISDKVSPWGLVKYQGKDSTMVLTKTITGAKDKITGTPIPFDPMKMIPQAQQPQ